MRALVPVLLLSGMALVVRGDAPLPAPASRVAAVQPPAGSHASASLSPTELTGVVQRYCTGCHNDRRLTGNLSLEAFQVENAPAHPETAEKMISKLRLNMMPPPGARRPGGDTLQALVETLEPMMDRAAKDHPNPGFRTFQRLNRVEYARSVDDLLGIEIDAADFLPPDTYSENFDNIADVQTPSSTVIDAYLRAAADIARMAVGDRKATATEAIYTTPRTRSQLDRVEGAPRGTRGGISVLHTFLADGWYTFKTSFYVDLNGPFFGGFARGQQLELSIDGQRAAMIEVDRFLNQSDPTGQVSGTGPIFVTAGQHRVSAAFLKTFDGPEEDIVAPQRQSLADLQIGTADGMTILPHLWQLRILGPDRVTGISDTPSRRKIFTCRPVDPAKARPCAESILSRLASEAYRRPPTRDDMDVLMGFYQEGEAQGGFEVGIRTAIQGILSSADFLFRVERQPGNVRPGQTYRVSDQDLATRLSFFLWSLPPDAELQGLAEKGKLSDPAVLEAQVRRMLQDPRSEALSTRFFSQWLRLQDLDKVAPEPKLWPYFDASLRDDLKKETQLFFTHMVQDDRSAMDILTADYTYLNEDLAQLYGIPGIAGEEFRKVTLPTDRRRGVLGQGSVLVETSHADRTSPVLRGKWIMEVLLNSPPPPPPPGVPALEQTEGSKDGRVLTVKERMALHRASPVCASCHSRIDPLGLALENFDVTGAWRRNDNENPVDPTGTLWDGTPLDGPQALRDALLKYKIPIMRTMTQNLMTYALGRRVEWFDQPTIRAIVDQAAKNDYRFSSFVLGVVQSDAFQRQQAPAATADSQQAQGR